MIISYAKNMEDVMLWRALQHIQGGFYLDVGAGDPLKNSCTHIFYQAGWQGINLETDAYYLARLRYERPRDINLKITTTTATTTISLPGEGGFSHSPGGGDTREENPTNIQSGSGESNGFQNFSGCKLNQVYEAHVLQPVHFLVVHTHGTELEFLFGLDLQHHRPWIILVNVSEVDGKELSVWEEQSTTHGYHLVYSDGINRFYLADEHSDLQTYLKYPPSPMDQAFRYADYMNMQELIELRKKYIIQVEETEYYQKELEAAYHSHSYRITAPLRKISTLATKISSRLSNTLSNYLSHLSQPESRKETNKKKTMELGNVGFGRGSNPRILMTVTNVAREDLRSGIQRVVKNLVRWFIFGNNHLIQVEPVLIQEGKIFPACDFVNRLMESQDMSSASNREIEIHSGDTLFIADAAWSNMDELALLSDNIHRLGGRVVTMVYDLLPLNHAEFWSGWKGHYESFRHGFETGVKISDGLLCISRAVADEVEDYIGQQKIPVTHPLDLGYFHLGAEIQLVREEMRFDDKVSQILRTLDSPLFLVVGTLEPRKGHGFVMDAFEILWQMDIPVRLCLAGKEGWSVTGLMQRIRQHPELGRRLYYVQNPSDHEINLLYKGASAAIMASCAEGFGLPIVEAALQQTPVLASDIPVFREVGGDGVFYFSLDDPGTLARLVYKVSLWNDAERAAAAKKIKTLTWEQSSKQALEFLLAQRVYKTLLPVN